MIQGFICGSDLMIVDDSNLRMLFNDQHHDSFVRYKAALDGGLCEEQAGEIIAPLFEHSWKALTE